MSLWSCARTALFIALVLPIAFGWIFSSVALYPKFQPPSSLEKGFSAFTPKYRDICVNLGGTPLEEFGLPFESVVFETKPGFNLRGWYVPAKKPSTVAAVLVHGAGGDRREMAKFIQAFYGLGMNTLLFDVSDQGLSDKNGQGIAFGMQEYKDVLAAMQFVREKRGNDKVVLCGGSNGAASVLIAAGTRPEGLAAVIAENPFSSAREVLHFAIHQMLTADNYGGMDRKDTDIVMSTLMSHPGLLPMPLREIGVQFTLWRSGGAKQINAIDMAPKIQVPTMLFHGDADQMIPVSHSQQIYDALTVAERELWVIPGGHHGETSFQLGIDAVNERIMSFLRTHTPELIQ